MRGKDGGDDGIHSQPLTAACPVRLVPALLLVLALAGCAPDAPADALAAPPASLGPASLGPAPPGSALTADSLTADSLSGTFEGHYSAGFEHSGFVPCAGPAEAWWTEAAAPVAADQTRLDMRPAADVHARYTAAVGDSAGTFGHGVTVFARLRGRATPRGPAGGTGYGHLGAYARAFTVDSVEAVVRDTVVAGCPEPAAVRP